MRISMRGIFNRVLDLANGVNSTRGWLSHAGALANQHYTADGKLSCTTSKTWRSVLQTPHDLDYGVGKFLLRISTDPAGAALRPAAPVCFIKPKSVRTLTVFVDCKYA